MENSEELYAMLLEKYPKGTGVYADSITEIIGDKGMDVLIRENKIELAGVLKGRNVYAI